MKQRISDLSQFTGAYIMQLSERDVAVASATTMVVCFLLGAFQELLPFSERDVGIVVTTVLITCAVLGLGYLVFLLAFSDGHQNRLNALRQHEFKIASGCKLIGAEAHTRDELYWIELEYDDGSSLKMYDNTRIPEWALPQNCAA